MLSKFASDIGLVFASAASTAGAATGGLTKLKPDPNAIPGSNVLNRVTQGIIYFSLAFCLIGLLLSAGLWAVGAFSNNYTQSVNGKKGFLICLGAALAIGAAFILVNWAFGAGGQANPGTYNVTS